MEEMEHETDPLLPHNGQYNIQETVVPDVVEEDSMYYPWEKKKKLLKQGSSSAFGAVFIIVNAALGSGLLAFPFAFRSAGGVVPGIVIQMVLIVFIVIGLLILAYAAERRQVDTYEDVIGAVWGPVAKTVAEICVSVYCFGSTVAFLVVIGDQIDDITSEFHLHGNHLSDYWWVDRRFTITIAAIVFILPWLLLRRIGVLSYTSFFAVLCCLYIAALVTARWFTINKIEDYVEGCEVQPAIPSSCDRSWPDTLNAIPFICFGYQCHVSSVPVYAGLKKRNLKVYSLVVAVAVTICALVYTLTGTFGYMTFAPHFCFNSDVLRNYCPNDVAVNIARAVLAFVIVTSYPILAFCGRTAIDRILMKLFKLCRVARWTSSHEIARLRVEGIVWLLVSLLLALFVPQISYVINPIGGLAAVFIFTLPGMCLLKLTLETPRLHWLRKTLVVSLSFVIITIGMFILGNSVVYTVMDDVGAFKS